MINKEIQQEITAIHERNKRVETDKRWETSITRRGFIAIITYVVAGVWLMALHDSFPWLKALVPAGGYIFSTLSVPFVKKWWVKNFSHNGL